MSRSLENFDIYNLGTFDGSEGATLLYAPRSCNCALVMPDELKKIIAVAEGNCHDGEYVDFFKDLADNSNIDRIGNISDFVNLSILPTNSCNFACSYCYSAKGRSSQTIDFATVENVIRWFIGIERSGSPSLHITIFGGGEPMLCWETVVRPALCLIQEMRKAYPSKIHITLITNGSVLPDDFSDMCLNADIDLAISFEILEELQNLQRRNYSLVYGNILKLCQKGVIPAINSVITDEAVIMMPKMVETAIKTIPGLRHISFEPVTGHHSAEFYRRFTTGFFEARGIAEKAGVKLTTSALRNVDVTVERYCAGELALTAAGDLTLCPCISSPVQPGYDRWIYGTADGKSVKIDTEKLSRMLSYDVNLQPWCDRCFARYNCGGGCVNKTIESGNKPDSNYCSFFRKFLRTVLIERIS